MGHITGGANAETFQPMNINFGLFPPVAPTFINEHGRKKKLKGRDRKKAYTTRALIDLDAWLEVGQKVAA